MNHPEHVLAHLTFWRKEISQQLAEWIEHCDGAVAVDRHARVVWISKPYLEALGLTRPEDALGRHILELTPHSQMPEVVETGRPILLDIWTISERSFVISRVPLKDEHGEVIGALGFVLYESSKHIKPLLAKFARLQSQLECTQSALLQARSNKYTLADMVGHSSAMQQLKRAARQDSTVLLLGETGTGKELLAHAIHAESARTGKPFVAINVAAIPDSLLEAELFGAAAGAYTGADRKGRLGKIQLADGGTLFLDEIGDMPLNLQAKLLRVLQEKEVEPLGSNRVCPVDLRVIAATSADLPRRVADGSFRADLYYRLNVLPLTLPPLRQRLDDLPSLCEFILARLAEKTGSLPRDIDAAALALLREQRWPGNLRQLRNTLEQAVAMTDGDTLGAAELRPFLPDPTPAAPPARTLADAVAATERQMIQAALVEQQGRVVDAARQLGVSRATLYKKLAQYGLGGHEG
ncbi:sigma-54 interaction domain-containing protein [Rivihabitans pingtungensis]|uniref:Transcriptional regulator with PAS, ATPase and Fis domain n=1 Tax=Rivihabitans pingtungensis TaxID=1054498 RepID=A0A318KZW1_9NEIS|nr:sigma 54-interacting transcriptional regulator [Rivihabitans pingtungensis]PXX81196.1 transcriptional regulator with PAS, ATPase and Fis domain [Rivihabitans pingtungensis]